VVDTIKLSMHGGSCTLEIHVGLTLHSAKAA